MPVEEAPTLPELSFEKGERTFVVGMIGEAWKEDPVTVHALRVGERGVELGQAIGLPRRGREFPAAAVDSRYMYLARGTGVERREPFVAGADVPNLNLGEVPASLLAAGPGCLVGLEGRVGYVDFSGEEPVRYEVHGAEELEKPVDFLVQLGQDAFVAVDDEVFPKYAMVFDVVPGKMAVHRFTGELPTGPNEAYRNAAVWRNQLVVIATYGVMDGSGNTLHRWTVEQDAKPIMSLMEHTPRMAGERDKRNELLAGDEMSFWQGLGIVSDSAFIGAGARGVLEVPLGGGEARVHDVGGSCLDLVEVGGRLIALVYQGKGDSMAGFVVILEPDGGSGALVERARHKLLVSLSRLFV
jgi:hypothetical protein